MTFFTRKDNLLHFFIIFFTSFIWGILFAFYIGKSEEDFFTKSKNTFSSSSYEIWGEIDFLKLKEAYSFLKREYYDSPVIKNDDIVEYAIKGMVDSLDDKHSEYLTAKESKVFMDTLNWDFEWIWAVVEKIDIWVKIERILKWSPAKKFGLFRWDIIVEANGVSLESLWLYEAVDVIKWPAGTKVVLKILRNWEEDFIYKEVIRQKIKIPSVDYEEIDKKIWYISINIFWEETSKDFWKALDSLKDKDGIIIDLRDNGWWYLLSAVSILGSFIENGKNLVFTKYKDTMNNKVYKSINDWDIFKWKLVVLINENSASASEIVAQVLREYNKAILVGKKSYGKWSVQQPFDLSSGWTLKLTIARWFTPSNKNIDKEWVDPDIEIYFKREDYDLEACKNIWKCSENMKEKDFDFYDRQREEAKKILENFIKYGSLGYSIDVYKK